MSKQTVLQELEATAGLAIDSFQVISDRTQLCLPEDLPLAHWCSIGARLTAVADSSGWWVGDWLVFGRDKFPDRYRQAIAQTSLDYQTLRNYAWVAQAVSPSRRRDALTFQHHMEVAALSPAEQDHWLAFAVRLKWSRNQLRRHVRANAEGGRQRKRVRPVSLQLELTPEQFTRWSSAAEQCDAGIEDWIVRVIDSAIPSLQSASAAPELPAGGDRDERP